MGYGYDVDDLVSRLRQYMGNNFITKETREAADMIQRQAARIAELESQLAAPEQSAEPVAWRWKHRSSEWEVSIQKPWFTERSGYTAEALYAAPQPSPTAVVLDDERAAFEVWWVRDVPAEYREMSINLLRKSLNEGPSYLKGAWHGWQARTASPQPVAQPVEQTLALSDNTRGILSDALSMYARKYDMSPVQRADIEQALDRLTAAQPASGETE